MAKKSIGEANVKLTVDGAEQVASKLKDVKSGMDDAARSGQGMGSKVDEAFGKIGERIESSTSGIRKFQGALSGVIGVVGGLAGVFAFAFGGIIASIQKARQEQQAFNDKIDEATSAADSAARSFGTLADSIETSLLTDDVGRAMEENTDDIQRYQKAIEEEVRKIDVALSELSQEGKSGGGQAAILEAERKQVIEEGERLIRALEQQGIARTNQIREQQKQATEQLQSQAELLRISTLDEESQIIEQLARREKELQQQISEASKQGMDDRVAALKTILEVEGQIAKKRIEGILEEQKAEQAPDNSARELAAALREAQRAMQEQAKAINDNTRELAAMRSRIINFTPDIRRGSQALTRRTR